MFHAFVTTECGQAALRRAQNLRQNFQLQPNARRWLFAEIDSCSSVLVEIQFSSGSADDALYRSVRIWSGPDAEWPATRDKFAASRTADELPPLRRSLSDSRLIFLEKSLHEKSKTTFELSP